MSNWGKISILVASMALLLGATASAQKFGYIDSDKIQSSYKDWTKAQEQFDTEVQAWNDEAAKMQQELDAMYQDYDKQKLILSADKKAEREAAIAAKEQALNSYTRDISAPGGKAERRMQELVKPLYEKIQAAIEQVAIEGNYDFIFNSSGLAYGKKELDITEKVLEILESSE